MNAYVFTKDELYHHGILGQKWGVRRYQNEDGSYTEAGKARRNKIIGNEKLQKKEKKAAQEVMRRRIKRHAEWAKASTEAYENHVKHAPEAFMQNLAMRQMAKAFISKAEIELRMSMLIDSDVVKAGKDYIVDKANNKILIYDENLRNTYEGKNKK